jgi:hypothetical protein
MATDYGEKERAFIDGLKENTGRDLEEWMSAITAQTLPHRNDIIDWLRQQGFMFSKASWLERIHHNGGKPIYADTAKGRTRVPSRRTDRPPAAPAAAPRASPPSLTLVASAPAPVSADLEALLAKAKAYRPLAQHVIARIKAERPGARFEARDTFVAIADPGEFAALGIGAKELRLHLALGEHPPDDLVKKSAPGGGLGKGQALSHMVVLTDVRQIDQRLLDLVRRAATKVNG